MTTRKQIRVFVDDDQWQQFKDEVAYREDNSDTFNRLLTELLKLRALVGDMEVAEVAQIHHILPELAQIHANPLVAVGICLGSVQQEGIPPKGRSTSLKPLSQVNPTTQDDDFIDNADEY